MKNFILYILTLNLIGAYAADMQPVKKLDPVSPIPRSEVALTFDPPISAGASVGVESYDKVSKTYKIKLVKEPGIGPNVAMPGDLASAISSINLKRIEEDPESILGNEYRLDKDLRLLSEAGVKTRISILRAKR